MSTVLISADAFDEYKEQEAEIERLRAENAHKESLLGQVWDIARDINTVPTDALDKIMTVLREKPDPK